MAGYIYLASPYSHPLPEIREGRFQANERAMVHYFRKKTTVFCPIVHWHAVALKNNLPFTFDYYEVQNDPLVIAARSVHILELDGWIESKGVQHEINVALDHDRPVYVVSPWKEYSARLLKDALRA